MREEQLICADSRSVDTDRQQERDLRLELGYHSGLVDLNGRARAYQQRAGDVSGPELVIDERPYQAGDDIVCLRNDRRLGVCKGTRATVVSVDPDAGTLTVQVEGRRVALPAVYLDDGNIAHGYATTQGPRPRRRGADGPHA